MTNQKIHAGFSSSRFVLLISGLLFGAVIASTIFFIWGSPFSINQANSQGSVAVLNAPTMSPPLNNPEVQIYVDQAYVSKIINTEIKKDPDFSNAVVDLRPPNLALITLDVKINAFMTVRPTVTLAFEATNNKVKIQVTKIEMGGFSVPLSLIQGPINSLTQMTQQRINALTEGMQEQTGLELTHVSATDMDLVLNLGESQPEQTPAP
jgi:hypothetical protein